MNNKIPLPTLDQIFHVRRLVACGLYDIVTVVRLTGVPLRDVFRIEKAFWDNFG